MIEDFEDDFYDPGAEHNAYGHELQHWSQENKIVMVTFRLGDSMPKKVIDDLIWQRDNWLAKHPEPRTPEQEAYYRYHFQDFHNKYLDRGYGSCVLANSQAAQIFENTLLESSGTKYNLGDYVVMPNHVHFLVQLRDIHLSALLKQWKGSSSYQINRLLGRKGPLWQSGHFETHIRNEEHLKRKVNYIYQNWVRGGVIYSGVQGGPTFLPRIG